LNENWRSEHGTAKPYSRHKATCRYADDPDHLNCRCSKWLYLWNAYTGEKQRYSLKVWDKAQAEKMAREALKGLDPKIAEERNKEQEQKQAEEKKQAERKTITQAFDKWFERCAKERVRRSTMDCYHWAQRYTLEWANSIGITYADEITPELMEEWHNSSHWTSFAPTTQRQRWSVMRSIFSYFAKARIIPANPIAAIEALRLDDDERVTQGAYTDEQVQRIFASIAASVPFNLPIARRRHYVERLRTFMTLLLEVGLDVVDATLHEPSRVRREVIEGKTVYTYDYRRNKTGKPATAIISEELAQHLMVVPLEPNYIDGMPFRSKGANLRSNASTWSSRVMAVIQASGVSRVALGLDKDGMPRSKPANVKQLRHTAAVRNIEKGYSFELVARVLGHTDVKMLERHYATYSDRLRQEHLRRLVSVPGSAVSAGTDAR
jgi:integrase